MKFIKMIIQFFPFMLLVGAVYGIFRFVYIYSTCKKGKGGIWEFLQLCFVCYIFALCSLVFVPEDFWDNVWMFIKNGGWNSSDFEIFGGGYTSRNLILQCLKGDFEEAVKNRYSLIANMIMFIPLGFFLPIVFKRIKPVHSVFICLAVTCFIETVQPVVCRTGDIDDVITNFFGGALGSVIACIALKCRK